MATRLFNLSMADDSSVEELDGYDDRNFLLRGSLNREPKEMDVPTCKEYVIKIVNHLNSNHEGLIQTQCDVMLFLQARGYKCPTPVPSIFNTPFVMCKIPRGAQLDSVALATDVTREYEVEIYDGEEYTEEEYFVCAVRLLTFVPGTLLNEIPMDTQLLFDAGMAVARLNQDLKDFGCPKFERTEFIWDLTCVEKVEQFLEVVDDHHRVEMVREVCEAFRTKVAPKLHVLPKQVIHGDVNYTNMLLTPYSQNNLVHDFGFIDFGDLNYSCRVFDIAISLMYILNHPHELGCGRSRMTGHFFAGYHSVNPLTDEEIKLLPVLVALRFCQSLVYGAFTNKYLDPDNEYLIETARNGWKNFRAFWKLPEEEMLKMWLQMNNKVEKREGN